MFLSSVKQPNLSIIPLARGQGSTAEGGPRGRGLAVPRIRAMDIIKRRCEVYKVL